MTDADFEKFSWVSRMHRNDEVSSNDLIAVYAEAKRARESERRLLESLKSCVEYVRGRALMEFHGEAADAYGTAMRIIAETEGRGA